MKRNMRNQLIGALCAGVLLTTSFGAEAAVTTAGTAISNTATVNYKVGGVDQTAILSAKDSTSAAGTPTKFVVDNKLILTVQKVDGSITSAAPGSAVTLTYKVTNSGNAAQGAILTLFDGTAADDSFGTTGTTEVAPTSPVIHVDDGDASYSATNDTATSINTIPIGGSALVYVTFTLPANGNNNDISVVGLKAQVADVGTSYATGAGTAVTASTGSWTADTEQNVFADTSNDVTGQGTDFDGLASAYNSALVTVTSSTGTGGGGTGSMKVIKTVEVVSDPVTDSGSAPTGYEAKAIPGAVMKYTIAVSNGGASGATNVSVEDDLSGQTNLDTTNTGASIVAYDNGATTATTCTSSSTPSCTFASGKVTVSGLTVDASKTATVTFKVKIK